MKQKPRLHALVTGATGGIGQGICMALIERARKEDMDIHITAAGLHKGERIDALVASLRGAGSGASGIAGDVTDAAQCRSLVDEAISLGGDLNALVCVAGASIPGRLADLSVADWDQTFNLNARSVWLMAQAARASLLRTRGSITAIASMSGLFPHPGYGAYSPAKAALVMLCKQLAQEWGSDGIRTNSVCPGMIRTPLTEAVYQDEEMLQQRAALVPVGRIGVPDDIGQAVAYLVGDGASYVNGVSLVVDGGVSEHMLSLIPGRPRKEEGQRR
ncbi:SDR family oxidoreductase [Alcaligenaceae bacterium CGII-47]|nr:SDR family oxidoreductase [Alcaligenaceae bacterium CGII-47]